MTRKNIKLQQSEFDELKKDKPDGVSWGHYLTEMRTLKTELKANE